MAEQQDPKVLKEIAKTTLEATQAVASLTKEMNEQLSVAKQLNDSYKQFIDTKLQGQFEDFTKSFQDLSSEITEMLSKVKDSRRTFADLSNDTKSTDKTVESLSKQINNLTANMTEVPTKKLGGTFKILSNIAKGSMGAAIGGLSGIFLGLWSNIEGLASTGKMLGGFFTNAVSWALQLGGAIIAIPVRFLGGLVEMAAGLNLHMTDYLQNIENIRDKFGNFRVGQSQAIKEMQKGFAKTTETGLSTFQIYGTLSERLKTVTELVEGLGATWGKVSTEMAQDGYTQAKRIDEFKMGLGLSNEQLKTMLMLSTANGKSASKTLTDLTKHVKGYAAAMNISHKDMTKDVAEAVKDAGKFGGATVDAIARASAYARGLGHELKEIAGVLDAFETFDVAAEGAAKLAQSFGATVDAFKLVSAQSPDQMIQSLRDAMFAAGKTADQMTRQEIKLLSSQTGLSDEVARSVFSMKNQGRSVEDLMKLQEKQEDAQTTQAKALKSLSEDIRRLVKEMQPLEKTFVKMFVNGMKKGITYSKDFIGLMMEIRQGLMMTWREGFKLGSVILSQVPALSKLTAGLRAFFEPKKFQQLAQKMRFILLDFLKGSNGVDGTLHKVQDAFTYFFNTQNPAAKQMIEGAKMILKRLSIVFAEGISWVGKQMTSGIRYITDVITGKQKIGEVGSLAGTGMGFLGELFVPILKSLSEVVPQLTSAVVDLFVEGTKKAFGLLMANKTVRETLQNIGLGLAGMMVTGIVVRALIGAITGAVVSSSASAMKNMLSGGGLSKKISSMASKVADASKKIPDSKVDVGKQTGGIIDGWVQAAISAKKVSLKDIGKLFLVITALGAGLGAAITTFAFGLKIAMDVLKGTFKSKEDFDTLGALIASITTLSISMALVGKIADPKSIGVGAIAFGAVGLFLGAMMGMIGLISKGMQTLGVTPTMLNAVSGLMSSIAKTMLMLIPVVIASAGLGALLMGPQGLIIGAAIAIGISTITASLVGLTTLTMSIVKMLSDVQVSGDIQQKANAFTSILGSINEMINVIAVILRELAPGIGDFLNVVMGGKVNDRLEKSTAFIGSLLPNVKGLIDIAKDSITTIANEDKKILDAAKTFGGILSTIGEFLKAVTPSPELLAINTEEYGMFSTKIVKSTGDTASYIQAISSSVSGFILLTTNFVAKLSKLELSTTMLEKGIPAISSLLSAIGSIMTSIIPSSEVVKQFKNIESQEREIGMFSETAKKTVEKLDTVGLNKFLDYTSGNFKTLMQTLSSQGFKTFLDDAANIVKSPQQLKSLEVIGNIIGSIANVVKSISDATKMPEVKSISGTNITTNFNFNPININKVLQDLAGENGGIVKMFDMIRTLSTSFGDTKNVTQRLTTINKVFESIGTVSTFVKTMLDSLKSTNENDTSLGMMSDVDKMLKPLTVLGELLNKMSQAGEGSLNQISQQMLKLAGDDAMMKQLKRAADQGVLLGSHVQAIKKNVIENGLVPALDAVKQMTDSINKMNEALANIELGKQSVKVGLQNVANAMGVGGKANYTINNKPINIHLEIQVEMKAAELERVLIFRKESVIRDQLRWIRGSEQGHDAFQNNELSNDVKSTYTQHVPG